MEEGCTCSGSETGCEHAPWCAYYAPEGEDALDALVLPAGPVVPGVRVLGGGEGTYAGAVLVDTDTGAPFGPVFDDVAIAESFLAWYGGRSSWPEEHYPGDLRTLSRERITELLTQSMNELSEDESLAPAYAPAAGYDATLARGGP